MINRAYEDAERVVRGLTDERPFEVKVTEPKGKVITVRFVLADEGYKYRVFIKGRFESVVGPEYKAESPYAVLSGVYNAWGIR